jgi:hypothetical protein
MGLGHGGAGGRLNELTDLQAKRETFLMFSLISL